MLFYIPWNKISEVCYTLIDYGYPQNSCCPEENTVDSGSFGEIKNCKSNSNLILKTNKSKQPFTRELQFIGKTINIKDDSYAKMYKVKNQDSEMKLKNSEDIKHIIAMDKMDTVLDKLLYSNTNQSIPNTKICSNKLIKTVKSFHTNTNHMNK